MESEIAWAMKQPDLRVDPSVSALNDDAAWTDLERMGVSSYFHLFMILIEEAEKIEIFSYENHFDTQMFILSMLDMLVI